jgi:SAM-dependent methyltransferase
MANVLVEKIPDFVDKRIYELSARGAFFEFLHKNVKNLVFSEYMDDAKPGSYINGILCQDVQKLTFDDCVFDICTSTEVFEHVPDDERGFKEVFRVLKDGGVFIFTVPLLNTDKTVTRVKINDGELDYLLEPEYHDDSIRGVGKVLVFRDYGHDIVDRLLSAGFSDVEIIEQLDSAGFGYKKEVIVAHKIVSKQS